MMDPANIRSSLTSIRTPLGGWLSAFAVSAFLIAAHPGCGGKSPVDDAPDEVEESRVEEVRSEKARKTSLSASDVKLDDLVRGKQRVRARPLRHIETSRTGTCSIRRTASPWRWP